MRSWRGWSWDDGNFGGSGLEPQQAKTLAKELNRDNENGDQVKQARAREIAERFKEKAARDREQSRSFSR